MPAASGGFVGVLRKCGLAACRLYGGVEGVQAGCPQRVGGFMGVLRPCGLAARSELEALWGCPCGLAARSELEALWGCPCGLAACSELEAVRAGCPQRVGGFVGVLRKCGQRVGGFMGLLRRCGLAARSELEASWA